MSSLLIKNVKILYDDDLIEGEIAIEDGKIIKVGKHYHMPHTDEILDGGGSSAIPGLIDVHVHLRDMELSYKEDFYSGTCAAAAGGFTTVIDMPNTVPPTNSLQRLKEKIESAAKKIVTNVSFHVMPPKDISEIESLVRAGAKSIKIYMGGAYGLDYETSQLLEVVKACRRLNLPLTVHAEGEHPSDKEEASLSSKEIWNISDYLKKHSVNSELTGMKEFLKLASEDDIIVFCHISSVEGLKYTFREAAEYRRIIREVTPHHLLLDQKVYEEKGRMALTNPPVRDTSNRRRLWESLLDGRFDIIASDHAPHAIFEKERTNIREALPGIPGLETTLPLLLTEVNKQQLTLSKVVELLSYKPAEIYRLKGKGRIREGFDGDIVLVDLKRKHRIDASKFHSKAKYSPFENIECTGKAVKTVLSGRLVMDEGEIHAEKGSGEVLQ